MGRKSFTLNKSLSPFPNVFNKHVGPPFCWTDNYAGRVACFPLVSHGDWANADGTDRRMDAR